jgi:hypothetical protein
MTTKRRIKLRLVGLNGNAFFLMGAFRRQAEEEGWPVGDIDEVIKEAQSRDYSHLLATLADHCEDPTEDDDEIV